MESRSLHPLMPLSLQRRSIEADFLLEIKEQHIERLKASNADYISQVVTLKATVKKVDLGKP